MSLVVQIMLEVAYASIEGAHPCDTLVRATIGMKRAQSENLIESPIRTLLSTLYRSRMSHRGATRALKYHPIVFCKDILLLNSCVRGALQC